MRTRKTKDECARRHRQGSPLIHRSIGLRPTNEAVLGTASQSLRYVKALYLGHVRGKALEGSESGIQ